MFKLESEKSPKPQKTIDNYKVLNLINMATFLTCCLISRFGLIGIVPLGIDLTKYTNLKTWNKNILFDQSVLEMILVEKKKKEENARKTDIYLLDNIFPITIIDKNGQEKTFETEKEFNGFEAYLKFQQEKYKKAFAKYETYKNRKSTYNNLIYLSFVLWTTTSSGIPPNFLGQYVKEIANQPIIPPILILGVETGTEKSKPNEIFAGGNAVFQFVEDKSKELISQTSVFFGQKDEKSELSNIGKSVVPKTVDPSKIPETDIIQFVGKKSEIAQLPLYFMNGEASEFIVKNGKTVYQNVQNPLDNVESNEANLQTKRLQNKMVQINVLVENFNQEKLINKIKTGELVPLIFEISLDGKYLLLPSFVNSTENGKVVSNYFDKYILDNKILECLQGKIEFIDGKFSIKIKSEKLFELQKIMEPQSQMDSSQEVKIVKEEIPEVTLFKNGFTIKNESRNVSKYFFVDNVELTNWILEQSKILGVKMEIKYSKLRTNFSFENEKQRQIIIDIIELNREQIISKTNFFINSATVLVQKVETNDIYRQLNRSQETFDLNQIIYQNNGKVFWGISSEGITKNDFNGNIVSISPTEKQPFVLPTQQEQVQNFNSQSGSPSEIGEMLETSITNTELNRGFLAKIRDWQGRIEAQKVYQYERSVANGEIKQFWKGHFLDTKEIKVIIGEITNYISKSYYGDNPELNEKIKNAKDASEIVNIIISAIENGEPITCQIAAFLTQAIFQITGINSLGLSGYLNNDQIGNQISDQIAVLTSREAHAFVVAQIMNETGQMELIIVESTPNQTKPNLTNKIEITTFLTQDIPKSIENWLEILSNNPDEVAIGMFGIISVLCLLIKTSKLNLKKISKEVQEQLLINTTNLETKIADIVENQKIREKYPIKNQLNKLTERDKLTTFYLLEMIKFDKLKQNLSKQEIKELKTIFEEIGQEIKLGTGLPNLRQEKYQNQLIQSLLEAKIPNYWDKKAKLVLNEYKLTNQNQTLEKILEILNSDKDNVFGLQNPGQVLAILENLKKLV